MEWDALLLQLNPLKRQLLTKVLKVEWAISHEINEAEDRALNFYSEKRRTTFNVAVERGKAQ